MQPVHLLKCYPKLMMIHSFLHSMRQCRPTDLDMGSIPRRQYRPMMRKEMHKHCHIPKPDACSRNKNHCKAGRLSSAITKGVAQNFLMDPRIGSNVLHE